MTFPNDEPKGLLVKPGIAEKHLAEMTPSPVRTVGGPSPASTKVGDAVEGPPEKDAKARPPRRFHGTVTLDSARVGRDAGRIADEVISHLTPLDGAEVKVTLEIEVDVPKGVPEKVVRIVTENARTLKFESQGFEEE